MSIVPPPEEEKEEAQGKRRSTGTSWTRCPGGGRRVQTVLWRSGGGVGVSWLTVK